MSDWKDKSVFSMMFFSMAAVLIFGLLAHSGIIDGEVAIIASVCLLIAFVTFLGLMVLFD